MNELIRSDDLMVDDVVAMQGGDLLEIINITNIVIEFNVITGITVSGSKAKILRNKMVKFLLLYRKTKRQMSGYY